MLRDKFSYECFIRVASHVPVNGHEDDLFAGLRLGLRIFFFFFFFFFFFAVRSTPASVAGMSPSHSTTSMILPTLRLSSIY